MITKIREFISERANSYPIYKNMITKIREFISERANSYPITKKQYDYLLPIYGNSGTIPGKLHHRVDRKVDKYYFIGTDTEYVDMLNRCKYINALPQRH